MKLGVGVVTVLLVLVAAVLSTPPVSAVYCSEVNIALYENQLKIDYNGCHLKQSYTLFSEADSDKNGYVDYQEVKNYENFLISNNIQLVNLQVYLDGKAISLNVESVQFLNLQGKYDLNDPSHYPVVSFKLTASFEPLKEGAHTFKADYQSLNAKQLSFTSNIQNSKILDTTHGQLQSQKVVAENFAGGNLLISFEVKRSSIPFLNPISVLVILTLVAVATTIRKRRGS